MNSNSTNYNNNYNNSSNYLDQAMSFEMIRNLCNGKGNAYSELGKFILIIGMDQFKILFKALVDKCLEEIKQFKINSISGLINPVEWIKFIIITLNKLFNCIISCCYKPPVDNIIPISDDNTEKLLNILTTDINLQLSFWEFVTSDSFKNKISYNIIEIKNTTQKDNNTFIFEEIWSGIEIELSENLKMIFNSCITQLLHLKLNGIKKV